MSTPKSLKYKGKLYRLADIPGKSVVWEKGKKIDSPTQDKIKKIEKSEEEAKQKTESLMVQAYSQYVNLQSELGKAEEALKKVEDIIKEASKSRIVKRISKLPQKDNEANLLETITLLSESMVRPGKDLLANVNRMLKETREKDGEEYGDSKTPSPGFKKFLSSLLSA